jgi:hypothetical protein
VVRARPQRRHPHADAASDAHERYYPHPHIYVDGLTDGHRNVHANRYTDAHPDTFAHARARSRHHYHDHL